MSYPKLTPIIAKGAIEPRYLEDRFADIINVKDYGATGDGTTDDSAAIQAALGSNRVIFFPPGVYSLQTLSAPVPGAYGKQCIKIQGLENFVIIAQNAVFKCDVTSESCAVIHIDQCKNFAFTGAKITASPTEYKINGLTMSSCTDFSVNHIEIEDLYAGGGGALCGSWLARGSFENIVAKNISLFTDHAFLYDIVYRNCLGIGLGITGSGCGIKGFSLLHDIPNIDYNLTGETLDAYSNNVSYVDCRMTNFSTGAFLNSGKGIRYNNCIFDKNAGTATAQGIGIFITYTTTGDFSSVGKPVRNVLINGCVFADNGSVTSNSGIYINPTNISDADDYIGNIVISGCVFDNNRTFGIYVSSGDNIQNVIDVGNVFSGENQTAISNAFFNSRLHLSSHAINFDKAVYLRGQLNLDNNKNIYWRNSNGGLQPVLGGAPNNAVFMRPLSDQAPIVFEDYTGNQLLSVGPTLIHMNLPTMIHERITLDNNKNIYWKDGNGNPQIVIGAAPNNGVLIRPLSNQAPIILEDHAGNYLLSVGPTSINMNLPTAFHERIVFDNNKNIYWKDSQGNAQVVLGAAPNNAVIMRPLSDEAPLFFEKYDGTYLMTVGPDENNPIQLVVNGSLKKVTQGAADSGGTGYRVLRVPNNS